MPDLLGRGPIRGPTLRLGAVLGGREGKNEHVDAQPINEAEAAHLGLRVAWLCQVAHWIASDVLITSQGGRIGHPQLSPREAAVMKWTAGGKTSSEVATILGIAERTVNFHLTNVMTKLNCFNKTAACVSALMLGLLDGV